MDQTYVYRKRPTEELETSTKDCKKYMIFTKRGVYSYIQPDFLGALRSHFWAILPAGISNRNVIEALSKFEFPEELDKIINIYNNVLQSDYDSVLYFVALDEGVAWKNPNECLFEKNVKYYSPLYENDQEEPFKAPMTTGVDVFFKEDIPRFLERMKDASISD